MLPILSILLAEPAGMNWSTPLLFVMIFVVFYLFMIRPQQKKQKDLKKFRENIGKGDKIVTVGGIHGKVYQVEGEYLILEIDKDVKIKIEKSAISQENSSKQNVKAEAVVK